METLTSTIINVSVAVFLSTVVIWHNKKQTEKVLNSIDEIAIEN